MIVSKEEALSLIQDHPKHFNFVDKTGSRFGMLQVHHYAGRTSYGKHQFACECDCGQWCLVTSVNLNETTVGCGCLQQAKWRQASIEKRRITVEETEEWILQNTPYLPICDNKEGVRSRWTFYCKDHGVFKANLNLVKTDRVGCPGCRPGKGFRAKFKGTLYVHRVYSNNECIGLKFGITNSKVERRKEAIESNAGNSVTLETIFSYENKDGKLIRNLETGIKKEFQTKVISRDILPDGFTETLSLEDESKIISWLESATSNLEGI